MRRLLLACLLWVTGSLHPASVAQAQTDRLCFNVPGITHCIECRFREFWEQHGGLAVFGYPITAASIAVNHDGGQPFLTQWFERSRFELHPENTAPYDVLLGRLGDDRLQQQGRAWQAFPKGQEQPGCRWFPETQHNLCPPFDRFWLDHGLQAPTLEPQARSLALLGLPISEAQNEANARGEMVYTQWFERGRLEYYPNQPDPFKVQLGLLGTEFRTGMAVVSHTSRAGVGGSHWIVGEVRNDTAQHVRSVKVVASFYDARNQLLGSEFAVSMVDIVRPGQRAPFAIVVLDPPAGLDHYALQLEWVPTQAQPLGGVTIVSSSVRDTGDGDTGHIVGEVHNESGGSVHFTKIVATLYDTDGRVVSVSLAYTRVVTLGAGESSPFEMVVTPWNGATRYELQVQAQRP